MTAQDRGWGPAPLPRWRVEQVRAAVSRATFPGGLHEDMIELAATLLETTERRGYHCVVGWCWGYADRMVRGSKTAWSNHAWGLALDINAPRNPMSSKLITDMPSWMPRMWEDCGFRWGGRYRTRPDAMHYEYLRRPDDVAGDLVKARQYLAATVPIELEEDDVRFHLLSQQDTPHLYATGKFGIIRERGTSKQFAYGRRTFRVPNPGVLQQMHDTGMLVSTNAGTVSTGTILTLLRGPVFHIGPTALGELRALGLITTLDPPPEADRPVIDVLLAQPG